MTFDHFRDEAMQFRRAMCWKANTICAIKKAFESLFFCANQTRDSRADDLWDMVKREWEMRMLMLMMTTAGHPWGTEDDVTYFPKVGEV